MPPAKFARHVQFLDVGPGALAAMSLRNPAEPAAYSMRRTGPDAAYAEGNIQDFARRVGFAREHLVMPRRWPHLGRVMVVDDRTVIADPKGGLNPLLPAPDKPGFEHSCDGLITTQPGMVIGIQGADCPMLYLHDPRRRIVGAVHCGWKPVAQDIVRTAVQTFESLGSRPADLHAHVGPGAGDNVYEFALNDVSAALIKQHGRTAAFRRELRSHPGKPGVTVLRLNMLVVHDLMAAGLDSAHITNDNRSCITDQSLHSYRRDGGPDMAASRHGLGIGAILLS